MALGAGFQPHRGGRQAWGPRAWHNLSTGQCATSPLRPWVNFASYKRVLLSLLVENFIRLGGGGGRHWVRGWLWEEKGCVPEG